MVNPARPTFFLKSLDMLAFALKPTILKISWRIGIISATPSSEFYPELLLASENEVLLAGLATESGAFELGRLSLNDSAIGRFVF